MIWLPILSDALAGGLLLVLLTIVWLRRPPSPLWRDLVACLLAAFSFVVGDAMTLAPASMAEKHVGLAFLYAGSLTLPALWFCVALDFLGLQKPTSRRVRTARQWLLGWAALAAVFAVTNPLHGLFLVPHLEGRNEYLPSWWAIAVVGWGLLLGSAGLFGWLGRQEGAKRSRRSMWALALATLLPTLGNGIYVAFQSVPLDLSIAGMAASSALLCLAVYRMSIFDVVPQTYREVLQLDPDAILICGTDRRIAYANPAAFVLFSGFASIQSLVGMPLVTLLDQLFGDRSRWLGRRPTADGRGSSLLARDRNGNLLRFEIFNHIDDRNGRSALALRLRDVTFEESRRHSRRTSMRHLERQTQSLLDPVVESTDRMLALLCAPNSDPVLKQQVRTVRSRLDSLRRSLDGAFDEFSEPSGEIAVQSPGGSRH